MAFEEYLGAMFGRRWKTSERKYGVIAERAWEPIHKHTDPVLLTPGEIYEFDIKLVAAGRLFRADSRIAVRIRSVDDELKKAFELAGARSLARVAVSRVTVFHNEDFPSYVLLPITKGNVLNTFLSGGAYAA